MSETKKQHYVPRFYLKRFANDDNKFFVYNYEKNNLLCVNPVPYESQCYKKYFYGEDGILESLLSEKEGNWATIIDKIVRNIKLSNEEVRMLKEFIIFQKQRTNDENNHSIEQRASIIKEYVKLLYFNNGWEYDESAAEYCEKKAREDSTAAENVLMASNMLKYVDDLEILIVHYNTISKLLTSDAPVITLNPFSKFMGFGYDCIGISFLMPVSPEYLVILYDSDFYTRYKNTSYIESDNEEEVKNVNKYELIHAESKVFTTHIEDFELISNDIIEKRLKEVNRNRTKFIGPENAIGRIIMSQSSGTDYYYDLPYLVVPREYRRIPFICREAIPRHFQEGWDVKLERKYEILSITRMRPIRSDLKNDIIPKGDLKMGCKRMESLGKKYWRSKGYDL